MTDLERASAHGISAFILEKAGTAGFKVVEEREQARHALFSDVDRRSAVHRIAGCRQSSCAGSAAKGSSIACGFSMEEESRSLLCRWGSAQGAYEAALKIFQTAQAVQPKFYLEFQAIQHKLADMATEIDAARLLTLRAAWLKDSGASVNKESAMAKLYASESAVRVANEALQIHGGYGFIKDYPVEKFYRDVKLCTIGEGTSEIQMLVIARQLLKS